MNEWDVRSFDFLLTAASVVVELGGYEGRWCGAIARRYNPRLFVYEPQGWAFERCVRALAGHNAQAMNYGLGTAAGVFPMGEYGTDGCSFLPAGRAQGDGVLCEWYEEMDARGIADIDLLLMNIEGYEYVLLPHILPMLTRVRFLMVQFHLLAGGLDYSRAYQALRAQIEATHAVRFDYGPKLVCWEVRA